MIPGDSGLSTVTIVAACHTALVKSVLLDWAGYRKMECLF